MSDTIKKLLTLSLAAFGFAALLVAVPMARTTNAALCSGETSIECAQSGSDTTGTSKATVPGLIKKIVNIMLYLIGSIAVLMIIIGGIRYVTSNGESGGVSGAKNTILYAVVGLIVATLAYAIVNFVLINIS